MNYNIAMTIYIAPYDLIDDVIDYLVKEDGLLFASKVLTPSAYIDSLVPYDIDIYEIYKKLIKLDLKDLKNSLKDLSFLKDLINDRKLIDYYHIDIDSLDIIDDYKKLLKEVGSYDTSKLDDLLRSDFSDVKIVDAYYEEPIKDILKRMLDHGATYLDLPSLLNHDLRKLDTLNVRSGIESIAQIIIDEGYEPKDCAICTSKSNMPLVKVTLKRYGLPYKMADAITDSMKAKRLLALIDLWRDFTPLSYRQVVDLDILEVEDKKALSTYLSDHTEKIELKGLDRFKDIEDQSLSYYKELEKRAERAHINYLPLLEKIKGCGSLKEAIILSFETIAKDDKESLMIKKIIEAHKDHLNESFDLLRQELEALTYEDDQDGIKIFDLHKSTIRKKQLFVLDPNSEVYPDFKVKEGFLDEKALEKTDYPALAKRYSDYMEHFKFFSTCDTTTFVLAESTLDGKALIYDERFKKLPDVDFKLASITDRKIDYDLKLKDSTIFFEDEVLKGSISSFESWFRCPYSYFLKRALKLYEPKTSDLDAAMTGTIFHKVMEELIKDKGKEYTNGYEATVTRVLDHYHEMLELIYPKRKEEITILIDKIAQNLELELQVLDDIEKNTDYEPADNEYHIDETFLDRSDAKVHINGYIDRIDVRKEKDEPRYFRILDYKTSDHTLSKEAIAKGEKLQLLTYIVMYRLISHLEAAACLYVNIKHPPLKIDDFKFSTKGLIEQDPTKTLDEEFLKAHKFTGLIFDDMKELDKGNRYIAGKITDGYDKRHTADINKATELLEEVYRYLYKHLKDGDISLSPRSGACTYCNYQTICHFKGNYDTRNEKVADVDIAMEVKDAE